MSETNIFSKMSGNKAIVRFVKEVEKHPCLYDQNSHDYSNRDLKRKTWIQIAKNVNGTVKDCKDKWAKIRVAYIRTLRPSYNESRPYKTPYYLAEHLKFITPMKRNSLNNSQSTSENNYQLNETNEIETNGVDEQSNDLDDQSDSRDGNAQHEIFLDKDCLDYDEEMVDENDIVLDKKENLLSEIKKTKATKNEATKRNENNSGRFVKKSACCDKIECNPRKMFLLSLLPDIDHLTEIQMRSFRRQVIRLLDDVLEE